MNTKKPGTVLVIGATGSVGRHVVAEAVRQGYGTRALVRDASRAGRLDAGAQRVTGELNRVETLADAWSGQAGTPTQSSRPGWFDYNDDDQMKITLLQGDTRHAGSPADGVIARHQIRLRSLDV